MSKLIDLTGQHFGMLVVVKRIPNESGRTSAMWLCKCSCGKEIKVEGSNLRHKNYKSCGCLSAERLRKIRFKHGLTNTTLYKSWACMKYRCLNPHYHEYNLYGGRGITVCDEWLVFENFAKWAFANGYKKGLSIDRLNPNGNYEPSNCRWATDIEQQNNRRNNHILEYMGEKHTIAEWARIKEMEYSCLLTRINALNWSIEKALNTPSRRGKRA